MSDTKIPGIPGPGTAMALAAGAAAYSASQAGGTCGLFVLAGVALILAGFTIWIEYIHKKEKDGKS